MTPKQILESIITNHGSCLEIFPECCKYCPIRMLCPTEPCIRAVNAYVPPPELVYISNVENRYIWLAEQLLMKMNIEEILLGDSNDKD